MRFLSLIKYYQPLSLSTNPSLKLTKVKKTLFFTFIIALIGFQIKAQTELVQNRDFSQPYPNGWNTSSNGSGDFYYNTKYPTQGHSNPGYAYASSSTDQPQTNLSAYLEQGLTIPSASSSATLSFWMKTTISGTSTGQERIFVYLYDNNTASTYSVTTIYFSSTMPDWQQSNQFSIPSSLFGHSLTLGFHAVSSSTPTTIRIDDVSLTYITSAACSYSISPSSVSPSSTSGNGSVSVTATSGCSWTAVSNNSDWLTVTSGSSGSGNGTTTYAYTANGASSPRIGTITIAGKTFTVTQEGTGSSSQGVLGVDISDNNGTVSWSTVYAAGKSFAYVKATEGTSCSSCVNYFNSAIKSSNPNDVVLGAYHLARPDNGHTGSDEATYFLSVAGSYIGNGYLPPALDMDASPIKGYLGNGHSIAQLAQWINEWCMQVYNYNGAHIWPVLYGDICNAAGPLYPYYQNGTINSNIKLWIADYSHAAGNPGNSASCTATPWVGWPWDFDQYFAPCNSCASNDPNTGMDLDIFNGDQTAFNNLINGSSSSCTDAFETNNTYLSATKVFADPLGIGTSDYTLNANIGYAGDVDWYQITTDACGTLTFTLSNLPYNYDMELYGPNGPNSAALAGSYNSGTGDESISYKVTSTTSTTYYIKVYAFNSSEYTTASCYSLRTQWSSCSVLANNLISFTAQKNYNDVLLNWRTANEFNVEKYNIEHSEDGIHFNSIGGIEAVNNTNYSFTDKYPFNGKNYYRLKVISRDSQYIYSNVVLVTFNNKNIISLYPNPATNKITLISSVNGSANIRLIDSHGKTLQEFKADFIPGGTQDIPVNNLSAGIYFVQVKMGEQIQNLKFVKN